MRPPWSKRHPSYPNCPSTSNSTFINIENECETDFCCNNNEKSRKSSCKKIATWTASFSCAIGSKYKLQVSLKPVWTSFWAFLSTVKPKSGVETGTLQRCITHDPERDQIHISFSQKEEASSGEDFIILWLNDASWRMTHTVWAHWRHQVYTY